MGLGKSFTMALSSIINNKMRSFLTMLGIIIGIAAVIILVSVMNGLTGLLNDRFEELGTKSVNVTITPRGTTKSVKPEEMFDFVEENHELFTSVTPKVTMSGVLKSLESDEDSITTACQGVAEFYSDIQKIDMAFGRFVQYVDCEREEKVCVLGSYEALYFFGSLSGAIDHTIKINGKPYKVVGVIEEQEDSSESSADNCVYIPYTVAAKENGASGSSSIVNSYVLEASSKELVTDAANKVKDFMEEKIGDSDYFNVTTMLSLLDMIQEMMDKMGAVLIAIAAISLLVGGIGIMNIMLVSVTERTREIGIRKSLGAKQKNIMLQFVMEAGTVSCIGGVIGILVGSAFALMAGRLLDLKVQPSVQAIIVAFCVSVGIGIVFGYLPAKKAAKLNPIDALRYE